MSKGAGWAALHRRGCSSFVISGVAGCAGRPVRVTAGETYRTHDQTNARFDLAHGHRRGKVVPCLESRPFQQSHRRIAVRALLFVSQSPAPDIGGLGPFVEPFLELVGGKLFDGRLVRDLPCASDDDVPGSSSFGAIGPVEGGSTGVWIEYGVLQTHHA